MHAAVAIRHRLLSCVTWMCLTVLLVAACGGIDDGTELPVAASVAATPVPAPSPTATADRATASPAASPAERASPTAPAPPAVAALSLTDGSPLWQVEVIINSGLVVGGDLLYVEDSEGSVLAIERASGVERWRVPAPGAAQLSADELGVYVDMNFTVHALDAATGQERWTVPDSSSVVADSGIVVAGMIASGGIRAIDALTGAERWVVDVPISERPIVAGDLVYAALPASDLGDAGIYAFDIESGAARWTYPFPAGYVVAVADGNAYAFSWERSLEVIALDAATGAERWTATTDYEYGFEQFAAGAGALYAVGYASESGAPLFAFEAATGALRWEGAGGLQPPVYAAGVLVLVEQHSRDGWTHLVALDAATGETRWSTNVPRLLMLITDGERFIMATLGS